MVNEKLHEIDLYELLGLEVTCTTQEVKSAFRKKALTCHPDKNPDNPRAVELFHQLSEALEILVNDTTRAVYDKVLQGRKAAKIRHQQLDSTRKKFKEDLEERERRAQEILLGKQNRDFRTDEEILKAEIERLRKEGSKLLAEQIRLVQEQVKVENQTKLNDEKSHRLSIRWNTDKSDESNGGYTYDILYKFLSKYGNIIALVVSPRRKGRAIVEYTTAEAAVQASQLEIGLSKNPLKFTNLSTEKPENSSQQTNTPLPKNCNTENIHKSSFQQPVQVSQRSEMDYEAEVLQRLRDAQKRKLQS